MGIYLDYNATTPIDSRVLAIMNEVYKHPGNADSRTHEYGEAARKVVENARGEVARMFDCESNEVVFTSGATESSNIAILGMKGYGERTLKKRLVTSSIEHHAVLNIVKHLGECGFESIFINPTDKGRVLAEEVISAAIPEETLLVSLMHVNNETGIIQPVKEVGQRLKGQGTLFHIDATQSAGKLIDEIRNIDYDFLSCSAHKFRGPQGIGALIIRNTDHKTPPLKPITFGGQQEKGIRPGTLPVALIAGMGEACRIAVLEYEDNHRKNKEIKKSIYNTLKATGMDYILNGEQKYCVDNTINIALPGVSSEALMMLTKGNCAISNGSACTSKSYELSHVLMSMGTSREIAEASIRLSWGSDVDKDEINREFGEVLETAKSLVG